MQPLTGAPLFDSVISAPSLHLPPLYTWIILGLGLAIFIFQTVIIAYHWYMYAPSAGLRRKVFTVHGIVSGLLVFLSIFGAFIITFTR